MEKLYASNLLNQIGGDQDDLLVTYSVFVEEHQSLYFSFEHSTGNFIYQYMLSENGKDQLLGRQITQKIDYFDVSPENPCQIYISENHQIFQFDISEKIENKLMLDSDDSNKLNGQNETIKNGEIFFKNPNGQEIKFFIIGKECRFFYVESNNSMSKYCYESKVLETTVLNKLNVGQKKKTFLLSKEMSVFIG
jgi:hypothetical protein